MGFRKSRVQISPARPAFPPATHHVPYLRLRCTAAGTALMAPTLPTPWPPLDGAARDGRAHVAGWPGEPAAGDAIRWGIAIPRESGLPEGPPAARSRPVVLRPRPPPPPPRPPGTIPNPTGERVIRPGRSRTGPASSTASRS